MKKLMKALACAAVALMPWSASWGDPKIPDNIQDSNILHCFDWTFTDIKAELPKIAAAGFGAIQVSPVQGNANTNAEWFFAYMPYDYAFKANGNGSRDQLKALCTEAAKYNIKIIVDVVANHVNQAKGYHDSWWDSNNRVRWNGGVNYGDRYSITHNQLGEYGDVNTELSDVQQRAKAFVEDLKSLGVKGIRWDAAKHIGLPSEGDQFWKTVTSVPGMWHYGEILDGPGGDKYKLLKEYTNYIGVTDSEYSKWTLEQVCNSNVPTGHGSWTPNGVPSNAVVYWGESHDDYSNDGAYGRNTSAISQDKIDRAYAIGACRAGETALYFSRPAATSRTAIKMGQKGSTHFTSKEIAEVNKFRNAMVGTKDYFTASNGIVCVTRSGGGAVIVIGGGGSRQVSVANGGGYVPAGTYKDQVTGNTFTVTSSTISGQVGSTGIAVVYNSGNIIDDPNPTPNPPDPIDPVIPTGNTVYYDNSVTKYNPVYVHYWGGDSESTWPGVQMTLVSGNIYKADVANGSTGFVFNNGNGAQTADATGSAGHLYKGTSTDNKTSVTDLGVYNGGGGDNPVGDMPANLYLIGNLEAGQWSTTNPIAMTKSGSKFIAENVKFVPAEPGASVYFSFITTYGADWDAVNGSNRYGSVSKDEPVNPNSPSKIQLFAANVDASAANSWCAPEGTYTVTADFSNMTMTLSTATGVELSVDEPLEAPVYYNLQGQRVENPTPGIYVVVRGKNVAKVIVR